MAIAPHSAMLLTSSGLGLSMATLLEQHLQHMYIMHQRKATQKKRKPRFCVMSLTLHLGDVVST